jgi:hypothetical protein
LVSEHDLRSMCERISVNALTEELRHIRFSVRMGQTFAN